jgi:putative chitinase
MQPWTREDLHRFAPPPARKKPDANGVADDGPEIHAAYVETLLASWDYMMREGIDTPLRIAHFMTIVGHETGGLTIEREECTWRYERMCELWPQRFQSSSVPARARYMACGKDEEKIAELAYGGWSDLGQRLGNTEPGDGWTYRGGGPFQGTGRAWYRETGQAIGVDLEGRPEQIEDPRISLRVCIWYWQRYKLGELADRNCLRAIQNQINRGNPYSGKDPNGWPSRQRWFDRAWAVFGQGAVLPSPLEIGIGAQGSEVQAVQTRLRELGYACGTPDGIFGPECRRAVAAFKADWAAATGQQLDPAEVVSSATRAALATAEPIRRPEREKMTIKDLVASGSTEAQAGLNIQRLGPAMLGIGAIGGASQPVDQPVRMAEAVDPTPLIKDAVGWVPQAKSIMVPVIEAMQWSVQHWWWVAMICLGIWMWAKGYGIIKARLDAARRGLNLWR